MFLKRLLSAALATSSCASFCDTDAEWNLAWKDDFDGSVLNGESWNVHVGSNDSLCRDSCCTANNIVVTNGTLVLMSKAETVAGCTFDYTSAAVTTQGKQHWSYSPVFRLCVSAILPGAGEGGQQPGTGAGAGIWPAHWMMPDDKSCWPDHGEMDILEMINGDGYAHGTYHWSSNWPATNCTHKDDSQTSKLAMPTDWGRAFHEYALEHGPGYVAFVYDGKLVNNVTGAIVDSLTSAAGLRTQQHDAPPPTPIFGPWPWYLMLNTAIGGPWPGPANASTVLPTNHTIDWVKVVTRSA